MTSAGVLLSFFFLLETTTVELGTTELNPNLDTIVGCDYSSTIFRQQSCGVCFSFDGRIRCSPRSQ